MNDAGSDAGALLSEPAGRRGSRVPDDPSLSVCILVLDHVQLALSCLAALRRPAASPPGTELVVVANGTPRDQLDALTEHEDVVLVANQVNLGFAAGCNQAASMARSSLLLFLNDDSTVDDGCIEALLRAASEDTSVGAVGARIRSVDGTLQEAGSVLWRDGSTTHVGEGLAPESERYRQARDVDYASANGLLVTRRAWDVVGGFDERYYPAYFEDVDLCLSLAAKGFRVRYEPRARITHRGSQSTSRVYRDFLLNRNQEKLVQKWGRALERFEPKPSKESGRHFDAAVDRAIQRAGAVTSPLGPEGAGAATDGRRARASTDPLRAAAELRAEYLDYLERRVDERDARVTALESYVSGLWGVRLRRWVGARLYGRT
jgi:O-antigen biosynthesis protein